MDFPRLVIIEKRKVKEDSVYRNMWNYDYVYYQGGYSGELVR